MAEDNLPWYNDFDEETKGYLTARGLDKKTAVEAVAETIKAHRNAESKLGIPADRVLKFPDASDADGFKALFQKLGVPASPTEYTFDGVTADEDTLNFVRGSALELNLTKDAAKKMAERLTANSAAMKAAAELKERTTLALSQQMLDASWGVNKPNFEFIANRAASVLGITPEVLGELAKQSNYLSVMDGLRKLGTAMGEGKLLGIGGDTPGANRAMTREEALDKKASLMDDRDFGSRWLKGEKAAVDELQNLDKIIVGAPRLHQ